MRSENAFTLLEVMLAVAIAAIGIVSILELFSGSIRLVRASTSQTQALAVASSIMDKALWRAELPEGQLDGDEDVYHWTLNIEKIDPQFGVGEDAEQRENESDLYDLMEIVVTVRWGAADAEKVVELQSARVMERF